MTAGLRFAGCRSAVRRAARRLGPRRAAAGPISRGRPPPTGTRSPAIRTAIRTSRCSTTRFRAKIDDAAATLRGICGRAPAWFRPPYGELTGAQRDRLLWARHSIVLWSVDGADWCDLPAHAIAARVAANLHHGAVVLLHDLRMRSAEALPPPLDTLATADLWPLTLSQVYPD